MEKTHDEEMAIDLWELISALKKRALIILAACLLGGVVAGVYTKLCITPMYTATSSMLVPPNRYVYGEVLFTLYFLQFFQC